MMNGRTTSRTPGSCCYGIPDLATLNSAAPNVAGNLSGTSTNYGKSFSIQGNRDFRERKHFLPKVT